MLHSDWDNTCEAVEQAVARESYLLWLRQQEGDTKGSVGESSRLPQVRMGHAHYDTPTTNYFFNLDSFFSMNLIIDF